MVHVQSYNQINEQNVNKNVRCGSAINTVQEHMTRSKMASSSEGDETNK